MKIENQQFLLKNGKEAVLRQCVPDDAIKYNLFSQTIASETTHTLHYKDQNFPIEILQDRWGKISRNHLDLGAFVENNFIAYLNCYKPRPHHPYELHVAEFGIRILEEYCSAGLGSKMLSILESQSSLMNFSRLQAVVRTSNIQGINFYLKRGFSIEGLKRKAVYINNTYEDEYFISKLL